MSAPLARLAWRNLARNPRRTGITAGAIATGLAALLFLAAFNHSLHRNMTGNFQDLLIGSLQIHAQNFFEHPRLSASLPFPGKASRLLEARAPTSPRLEQFSLAVGKQDSAGVLWIGLDPGREVHVTRLQREIVQGRFLRPGDRRAAVLGADTAHNLHLDLGDEVVLVGNDRYGIPYGEPFTVVGLMSGEALGVDWGLLFTPLQPMQEILDMQGRVTSLVARIPPSRLDATARELQTELGSQYEVHRWRDMFPVMDEWYRLSEAFHRTIFVVVLGLVGLGVANTLLVAMLERIREFGVMLALGCQNRGLVRLLLWESALLGLLGVGGGLLMGMGLLTWLQHTGIPLGALLGPTQRYYVDPVIYPSPDLSLAMELMLALWLITLVAGLYPAWQVRRLEPIEAMRHA